MIRRRNKRERVLRAVHPNAGLRAAYRRALEKLIDDMHDSVRYWIKCAYRKDPPILAQDESKENIAKLIADLHDRALGKPGGAAEIHLPNGAVLYEQIGVAKTGKITGTTYRIRMPGETSPKKVSQTLLRTILEAEAFAPITPAAMLADAVSGLARRWQDQFDAAAPRLADYFSTAIADRSDAALRSILREGGWSVKFQTTPAVQDVITASVAENVALIKSIPSQYLTNVQGLVMRSVQAGRDLGPLAKALEEQYGVTRRRAALVARDQNNKSTAATTRARQIELGIEEAVWLHSAGGKKPRPTHVAKSGKRYNVAEGWYDPHEKKFIHPGELINCRCVAKSVVPGFS